MALSCLLPGLLFVSETFNMLGWIHFPLNAMFFEAYAGAQRRPFQGLRLQFMRRELRPLAAPKLGRTFGWRLCKPHGHWGVLRWTPDFLLGEPAKVPLRRPLSYQDALFTFRHLPLLNAPAALSCSLHSMKVTALAAAKQLRLSRDSRAEQGDRVARSDNVQLYGRDDVSDALHVQEQIIRNIRQGWRPLRVLSCGSQAPLPDLAFPKTPLAADALWPQTTQLQDSISFFSPDFAISLKLPPCSPPSDPQQEAAPLFVSDVEGSDSSSASSSSSSQDQQVLHLCLQPGFHGLACGIFDGSFAF